MLDDLHADRDDRKKTNLRTALYQYFKTLRKNLNHKTLIAWSIVERVSMVDDAR
tara:strand:+ start:434 stop:595 length:162 start_codon:yes stop_codon:yes gene_type:complete